MKAVTFYQVLLTLCINSSIICIDGELMSGEIKGYTLWKGDNEYYRFISNVFGRILYIQIKEYPWEKQEGGRLAKGLSKTILSKCKVIETLNTEELILELL